MKVISKVSLTEHIAVVSFESAPAGIKFLSEVFTTAAKAGINVDMISQTSTKGLTNSLSFTVIENRVSDILGVVKSLEKNHQGLKPMVSIGNVKISLFGEEMPNNVGIAADVYERLYNNNIDTILTTTSDVDISVVVHAADGDMAYKILHAAYAPK